MEEKQLTNQQSLDLIAQMINNTRRNFNDKGGSMFLIWGYTTIVVTLAVSLLLTATCSENVFWLWWALPLVGGTLTWLHFRKRESRVQTHLDRMVNAVWVVFAVACMACMLFSFGSQLLMDRYPQFNILFTIALLIGCATALTGVMIKYRPVTVGGIVGIVLSFLIILFRGMEQFYIFAGIFLLAQVIPGHMLNRWCRKETQKLRRS